VQTQDKRLPETSAQTEQNGALVPSGRAANKAAPPLSNTAAVAVQVQEDTARQVKADVKSGHETTLTDEELTEVKRLKDRDREVRAHEAAHASAGRGFTGSPNYEYATGPDGARYAVGGHVNIDTAEVPDNPEATIAKMEVVRAAALAPAQPSGQDRAVAAAAGTKAQEARAALASQKTAEADISAPVEETVEEGGGLQGLSRQENKTSVTSAVADKDSNARRAEPININVLV